MSLYERSLKISISIPLSPQPDYQINYDVMDIVFLTQNLALTKATEQWLFISIQVSVP